MIDTHCHLTYERLHERVEEVLNAAAAADVDRMITVGTSPTDSQAACDLAERFNNVYATVGVHPHEAACCTDKALIDDTLRRLAGHRRVVALGEIGLDTYYKDPPLEDQLRLLDWQLALAAELPESGPIVIHNRQATQRLLSVLEASGIPGTRFVFHCFTGDEAELDSILTFGAMVSFTGIVTFANARNLATSAARVPVDRLMIETDSPYLTPEPHRKVRPNEPRFVPFVAEFLAVQRGVEKDAFVEAVDENAVRFFGLNHRA